MRILVDEMYSPALVRALTAARLDALSVRDLGLAGAADNDVFAAASADKRAVLTENVGDFTRIAAEHSTAGRPHAGVIIALSARFSRRPAGVRTLVSALQTIDDIDLADRVIYLRPRPQPA